MKDGGKNKSVAFIILFSVYTVYIVSSRNTVLLINLYINLI